MIDPFAFLVVVGTTVWVWIDSRNIGIKKGSTKGFFNMGPTGWFLACLLCWIVAFPVYVIKRREHLLTVADGSERSSGHGAGSGSTADADFGAQLETLTEQSSRGQLSADEFRTQRLALAERVLEQTPQTDFMTRLNTLADLSTQGFLTDEEFQAWKKDLTRRMLEESSDADSPVLAR